MIPSPSSSTDFESRRLILARAFRGLTQARLGEEVCVSAAWISRFESGKVEPKGDLLEALAQVLGFDPRFFFRPLIDEFREEECNFRRRASTPEQAKKQVLAFGTLFSMLVEYLRSVLDLPKYDLPAIPAIDREAIERAAETCRQQRGLGLDTPVGQMGRFLEHAGVVLVRQDRRTEKVDAFSRFGRVTLIVFNTTKRSASRSLFDAGHELGHLILHQGIRTGTLETERQADWFSAAFLLPRKVFAREFPRMSQLDWPSLFELKRRWRVSVSAIIRRAYDLRLLDAVQYRQAYKYMHAKGWHKGEPQEPEPEHPELIKLAFESLQRDLHQTPYDVSEALGWRPRTLEEIAGIELPPSASDRVVHLKRHRQPN